MKVRNMTDHNGNKVPDQFEITDKKGDVYFQSYNTVIAKIEYSTGKTYLDENSWNNPTSKYRNLFLGLDEKATEAQIKTGEIILTNLNS